jgi:hypothetical protein
LLIAHLLDGSLKLLGGGLRLRGSSVGCGRGHITGQLLLQRVALRAEPASGEEDGEGERVVSCQGVDSEVSEYRASRRLMSSIPSASARQAGAMAAMSPRYPLSNSGVGEECVVLLMI